MAKNEPVIITPRLHLSSFDRGDAQDVFAYASNPNVSRFTTWRTHQTMADAEAFIEVVLNSADDQYCWAIRLKEEPTVIGAIEFGLMDEHNGDIHFVLAEEHWNKGLMSEAARGVLGWAFERMPKLERVTTSAMAENVGSRRVLEKCGMALEGEQRERWGKYDKDIALSIYSISRSAWAAV